MIIRVYRALDPEGTEVRLMSLDVHQPGDEVIGLDGWVYTILDAGGNENVLHS